jgi:CotH kinase protein
MRHSVSPRVLLLLMMALNMACSSEPKAKVSRAGESEEEPGTPAPAGTSVPAPAPSPSGGATAPKPPKPERDLYDPDIVPEIELGFDAAAMAILTSAAEADKKTWVHATFKLGDVSFADVGVRRKGSATWRVLPAKTSLKVKLNKWVKGQKLNGLEELTLNNMVSDATFLHERLSYYVFRGVGLPAPKANTAHVTINGEDYGIFLNLETPDENFLEHAFAGKAISLYEVKSRASTWLPGVADGFEIDIGLPGAPEGTRPDLDLLLQSVATAKDETLLADLDSHLQTKQWLRFCAAEAITGAYDGYAFGTYGYSHNYFVAGDTDGKFALLPWSTDLTMADRGAVMVDASTPLGNTVFARCKKSEACWSLYKTEVASALVAFESLDLVQLATKWHDQIDPLVRSDPKREKTLSRYEDETPQMYDWIEARPTVIRTQLGL